MNIKHQSAGNIVIHSKPRAASLFKYVGDQLPVTESIKKSCNCSKIHTHYTPPKLVRSKSGEFRNYCADDFYAFRNFKLKPHFNSETNCFIIYVARQIVHPVRQMNDLLIRILFAHLLD